MTDQFTLTIFDDTVSESSETPETQKTQKTLETPEIKKSWKCIDLRNRLSTDFPANYKKCPALICSMSRGTSNTSYNNILPNKVVFHPPKKVKKFLASIRKNPNRSTAIEVPLFIKIFTKTEYYSQHRNPPCEQFMSGFESFGMVPDCLRSDSPCEIKLVRGMPSLSYNAYRSDVFDNHYKLTYIRYDSPLFENVLACIYEGVIYIANHGPFVWSLSIENVQCSADVDANQILKN